MSEANQNGELCPVLTCDGIGRNTGGGGHAPRFIGGMYIRKPVSLSAVCIPAGMWLRWVSESAKF